MITTTRIVAAHIGKKTKAIHCRKLTPNCAVFVSMLLSFTAPVSTAVRNNVSVGSGISRYTERRRMTSAAMTEPAMTAMPSREPGSLPVSSVPMTPSSAAPIRM